MKLKIMQSESNAQFLEKNCGYSPIITYDEEKHGKFDGDVMALAVAKVNTKTGEIENNFITKSDSIKEPDAVLKKLLDDAANESDPNRIKLIPYHITQFDDSGKDLIDKIIWMIPYKVIGHSSEMPTIMSNIYGASNTGDDVTVELLLVEEDNPTLHRYMTVKFHTRNVCIMELVKDLFEECTYGEIPDELKEAGMTYMDDTSEDESGFCIKFYDECGNAYNIIHEDGEDFLKYIVSMRLIGIEHHIDEN